MWNRDILRQLCYRLDDQSIEKLAESWRLWEEVTTLLKDNSFWKERTEYIAEMSLPVEPTYDWVEIYYNVLRSTEHKDKPRDRALGVFEEVYLPGLKHVNSLLILFDIYGIPAKPAPQAITELRCSWIRSGIVLRSLIRAGYV